VHPPGPKGVNKLSLTLWSIWSWFVFGTCILLWLPMMAFLWLVTAPFDPSRYWTGYLFRRVTVVHQRLNPLWTFRVGGTMPDNPRNPYVVVSNHESFVDILLISHLPWEMKWLSKKENFKIPVAGWLMRLARDIELDRKDPVSAAAAMKECRTRLDDRVSVMIFPEGTRSTTGDLLPFKDGAFRLAIEAQVPILPLAVHGAATALRAHDWRQGRSTAEVRVLEPVSTEGMTLDDVPALKEQVRSRIVEELVSMGRSFDSADEVGTIFLTEPRDVEAAAAEPGLVGIELTDPVHVGHDVVGQVDHRSETA
jgi:1-acyl-sn-glycerol-3-phosphate acyltransferase